MTLMSPLIKPREAARLLGVSPATLRRIVASGRLPAPVQISDRRLGFRLGDIEAFISPTAQTGGRA